MLHGFGVLIFRGALTSLELALSSAVLAVAIGMLGCRKAVEKRFSGKTDVGLHYPDKGRAGSGPYAADLLWTSDCF